MKKIYSLVRFRKGELSISLKEIMWMQRMSVITYMLQVITQTIWRGSFIGRVKSSTIFLEI